ncbi:MAG: type I secretion system permease/ATPase [Hyphomicrobiales bacterium]
MVDNQNPISTAMKTLKSGFVAIALFSLVLNLLMLTGPLYMLQVYDRVLTSQNEDTLIALSLLLAGAFLVIGLLEFIRSRILSRLGTRFELDVGIPVLTSTMRRKVEGRAKTGDNVVADVNAFRDFLSGSGLIPFFDMPWVPIYLGVLFILHPYLGLLGVVGAVVLIILAMINSSASNEPMQQVAHNRGRSDGLFATCERNAELIQSMGMRNDLARRWNSLQITASYFKTQVTDRISTFATISKTFRMALQSAVLGVGAALAIAGDTSAGAMIAATIIIGRALAPIDQGIGQWRTLLAASTSFRKLKRLTLENPAEKPKLLLPNARSSLSVNIQKAGPPLAQNATLSNITFNMDAGDVVAVIGRSGSGKSTLARMLSGIWFPQKGEVCFDKNPTTQWNSDQLGRMVGYLPQDVELFDGTIRNNIARFADDVDDGAVYKAATDAGVHDMILDLPDGYESELGKDGLFLSGGQRQRLGLARALYKDPFLLVLDEPNSNLDANGDTALLRAVQAAQRRRAVVVVMTHRPSALQAVNKVLILNNGTQTSFGPKEEVLRQQTRKVFDNNPVKRIQAATDEIARAAENVKVPS